MQEARDSARIALRSPWWTLGCPFEKIADLAGFKEQNLDYIREKLSEEMKQAELKSGRSPEQIALDQVRLCIYIYICIRIFFVVIAAQLWVESKTGTECVLWVVEYAGGVSDGPYLS